MKKTVQFISALIALTLSLSCFIACNNTENETSVQEPSSTITSSESTESTETELSSEAVESISESESTETVTEYLPEIAKKDYSSDFFISVQPEHNPVQYHWVEESQNDVMSQAVFNRQQKILEYLGVDIFATATANSTNYIEPFKNAVKNKDGSVDTLLSHVYHGIDGFITGNYLSDLNNYPQLNFNADYWNLDIMEDASINGKMFLGKSKFNILWTCVIAYNKTMMEKYGDSMGETVYDMVDGYRWTLDKMISIANLVYIDETSDGQTMDDTFGIIGCQDIAFCGFLHSSNINIIEPDESGNYVLSVYNDVNKAKTTDIIEKIHNLAKSDCAWFWKWNTRELAISFVNQKALFSISDTKGHLPSYPNYDISFGVLPYPIYDENQKDVGYRSLQWGGYICIPSYVNNPEMVGDTIEMLSFFSDDVNEAFYEKLLGKQASDSPDDRRMLQIVWDGICTDFAQTYYSTVLDTQILFIVPYQTYEDVTPGIASFVAARESSINKKIAKFITLASKKN